MKHTPGPWQVNHNNPFRISDSDGVIRGCAPIAETCGTLNEKRANARLIAASPDLLAACRVARSAIVFGNGRAVDWNAITNQLADAISKATGEQA